VTFFGHAKDDSKRHLFAHSDVLVLPSHTENFGMVAAEALANAVPVIVSKGAPWQRVEEIGCGLWVENDAESIAAAVQRIARMPLRSMGDRGRAWMVRDFSWPSKALDFVSLYTELVG
jgi:glycosyltransferase involved in cell wall biosynthesis